MEVTNYVMLLPKNQYFSGVLGLIFLYNQSDILLGCKHTHLYSQVFLRYPELNSISENIWSRACPQLCAVLFEDTQTLSELCHQSDYLVQLSWSVGQLVVLGQAHELLCCVVP